MTSASCCCVRCRRLRKVLSTTPKEERLFSITVISPLSFSKRFLLLVPLLLLSQNVEFFSTCFILYFLQRSIKRTFHCIGKRSYRVQSTLHRERTRKEEDSVPHQPA